MSLPTRPAHPFLAAVTAMALAAGCSSSDPCDLAAAHLEDCFGVEADLADCTPETADAVLAQSCDSLGKADFFDFLCQVFGIFCPPPPAYEPCADRVCGEECTLCDPDDSSCFETQEVKLCDAEGQCAPAVPACEAYEPCAGKECGEECTLCDPADSSCFETQELKLCDPSGECVSTPISCT